MTKTSSPGQENAVVPGDFWTLPAPKILAMMETSNAGLNELEASSRRDIYGFNLLKPKKEKGIILSLLSQFKSPLILLLLASSIFSFFIGEIVDGSIIIGITIASSILSFVQEHKASNAVAQLLARIQTKVGVYRDGVIEEVPVEYIVPGDIVHLSAGKTIPGDAILLESNDLFVNEATLTGETYPAEKQPGTCDGNTPLAKRSNMLFMGTNVVSGEAKAIVIKTGVQTEFGKIYDRLKFRPPETDFEHGIHKYGSFLVQLVIFITFIVFAANVLSNKPVFESLLFALALAVAMTPELLPAIVTITLARGAKKMANVKSIVKRLNSIENFGSMDVLCSDKTGTLTEGIVHLRSAIDVDGHESEQVFLFAYLNACFQTGYANPIDSAIKASSTLDISAFTKLDEVPYDFIRKRLTILVSQEGRTLMISKGALSNILDACNSVELSNTDVLDLDDYRANIQEEYERLSSEGYRVLGIAYSDLDGVTHISHVDEKEMIFLGFLVLHDPLKQGIADTLERLNGLGIKLKVITGDNKFIALNIGKQLGLGEINILTGPELRKMSDEALLKKVNEVDIFSDMEPNQKERVITALKKVGKVVGYMGDGINDATALHSADVGISVDSAVDVAKDAADIVLLDPDLNTLIDGVREGRRTLNNTLKYIFIEQSSNFGNDITMAWTSMILPFLPMLPAQILLANMLTDIPSISVASDNVDEILLKKPGRWNIIQVRNFMIFFGLINAVFDAVTFYILLNIPSLPVKVFQTVWFMETMLTEMFGLLILRSRKPLFKTKPSKSLAISVVFVITLSLLFPFTPVGELFEFTFIPPGVFLVQLLLVGLFILTTEVGKKIFYRERKRT